jgi:hypothetical protein
MIDSADASAAAEFSAVAEALAEVSAALPKVFDSEIRDSFRLCPASFLTCKIIGPKIRSCAKNINGQTSKQIARFGDTNFGETITA